MQKEDNSNFQELYLQIMRNLRVNKNPIMRVHWSAGLRDNLSCAKNEAISLNPTRYFPLLTEMFQFSQPDTRQCVMSFK